MLVYFIIILGISKGLVFGAETFTISFSNPHEWSPEQFVAFPTNIPELKEFTACHWQRDVYFAEGFSPIWALCSAGSKDDDGFKCFGVYTDGLASTANRHIKFGAWFEGWQNRNMDIAVNIDSYRHRRWNHYCWSYSSHAGISKFFYNGMLIEELDLHKEYPGFTPPILKGTREGNYSAFIIGQDQDGVRKNYSPLQSFYGNISELNIWDEVQDDENIAALAACQFLLKGNIVAWNEDNFEFSNVQLTNIDDEKTFCKESKGYIIFAEKLSFSQATTKCASIGGNVIYPESQYENKKVIDILSKHTESCAQKPTSALFSIGKLTWLGVVKRKSQWYQMTYDVKRNYKSINYTNWGSEYKWAYALEDGCAYINTNGTWGYDEWNVCNELRLCGICSITRAPV